MENNGKENSRFRTGNYYNLLDDEDEHQATDEIEIKNDKSYENEDEKTDESETKEKVQPKRTVNFEPIKTSREIKKIKSTNEFVSSPIKERRATKQRERFEPDF